MNSEELSAVVALICGDQVKFEVEKMAEWRGVHKWVARIYRPKILGLPPEETVWTRSGMPEVFGPSYKQAWNNMCDTALRWADQRAARKNAVSSMDMETLINRVLR